MAEDRIEQLKSVLAESVIGRWTDEEIARYENAQDAFSALVAHCTGRINAASDQAEVERLRNEQMSYVLRRRDLDPGDHEAVEQAISEADQLLGPTDPS